MATSPVKLIINRQSKSIYAFSGSADSIPAQFQSNVPDFEISVIDAPPISGTPIFADLSAYTLRVAIGPTPTGTAGGPATLALQTSWTWAVGGGSYITGGYRFTGNIALNTTDIDTYIGALAQRDAIFEITLIQSGNHITIYQGTITLKAVVDEGTSTVPTPVDAYMTKNETLATFPKKVGNPGDRIVLPSPNGVYARELGCNDDGSPLDNIITL